MAIEEAVKTEVDDECYEATELEVSDVEVKKEEGEDGEESDSYDEELQQWMILNRIPRAWKTGHK